jgi:hypothetical protein
MTEYKAKEQTSPPDPTREKNKSLISFAIENPQPERSITLLAH